MRHNWMRRGQASRWDMRRRALLRAWNDEATWISLADWIMGWGVILIFVIYAALCYAAYLNIGVTIMYALCSDPDFYPAFRIKRKILINQQDLDTWRTEQQKAYSEKNKSYRKANRKG